MYTHVYACIRMYTHVYACIRMHTHAYACIRMHAHIRTLGYTFTYKSIQTHPHMHACMYTYIRVPSHSKKPATLTLILLHATRPTNDDLLLLDHTSAFSSFLLPSFFTDLVVRRVYFTKTNLHFDYSLPSPLRPFICSSLHSPISTLPRA